MNYIFCLKNASEKILAIGRHRDRLRAFAKNLTPTPTIKQISGQEAYKAGWMIRVRSSRNAMNILVKNCEENRVSFILGKYNTTMYLEDTSKARILLHISKQACGTPFIVRRHKKTKGVISS